jgi:hypothetical protein
MNASGLASQVNLLLVLLLSAREKFSVLILPSDFRQLAIGDGTAFSNVSFAGSNSFEFRRLKDDNSESNSVDHASC